MDLLDNLDLRRFDALAIADAASDFATLPDAEQDSYLDLWDFAGIDEARHPLSAFLPESRNDRCVVRDLDGTLILLWQEHSTSDQWLTGPLFIENLVDIETIEESLSNDPDWLSDRDVTQSLADVQAVFTQLPHAPGPVMSC